ncbi:chemotaxis protein CheA [Rhodovulum sp. 12E13]|uniref:chemotaxis protein CheA n=1 Tax=Rhodovulum sp. 12E13 TaxID=2203891 RepID=UPI000E166AD3|nr:chemotaxis protein CheA [Rhodovulum sp. 12E13]RDC74530.1 chemotaxis protein CheA [Rhodovulum sp. 12E13]
MSDPMAEIRASFFIECEELLEALQDGLAAMDGGDTDAETINICFRAVHSMKGGAGAFGLESLVRFAHRYETVMDEIRAGRLAPDRDAMMLFFRAADVLSDIVRTSRDGEHIDEAEVESVLGQLEALAGGAPEEEEEEVADFQPMGLAIDLDGTPELPADAPWTIRFAPHAELFRSGNEPQHLLRALAALGEAQIVCRQDDLPPLDEIEPEAPYLAWEITLDTDKGEEEIREIFDFVDGICTLEVSGGPSGPALPPLPDLSDLPGTIDDGEAPVVPQAEAPVPDGTARRITLSEPAGDTSGDGPGTPLPSAGGEAPEPAGPPAAPPTRSAASADPAGGSGAGGGAGNGEARQSQAAAQTKPTVRVDLERIDRLVNLVGELVINQAMLSQSVQEAGIPSNSPVSQGLEEFMQLTRDIQDSVMMIRAQPVKSLFQRMSRIVREASAAVDKRVRLKTEGEATEVDKTVIERLADPLTHMIRNAVDHGLESGEKRRAAGKSEEGVVTLTAAHRSGRVVIEVADDGGGINRPRVRQIAEEKGLIPEGLSMTDSEIDNLLFMPGFSTASQISDLSGRGVGMDVVRSSIQELGGRITIASEPGVGTTFSISLPLTLAVLDGMVVRAGGETLVVPLGAIVETLSLADEEIRSIGPGRNVLHIRDTFVPLLDLAVELDYRGPLESYDGSVVLLIQQEDGARAALVVDSIEEQRQVVIKGLQDSYGHVPGIAAATILGDGQIALILDPVDLMSNVAGRSRGAVPSLDLAG